MDHEAGLHTLVHPFCTTFERTKSFLISQYVYICRHARRNFRVIRTPICMVFFASIKPPPGAVPPLFDRQRLLVGLINGFTRSSTSTSIIVMPAARSMIYNLVPIPDAFASQIQIRTSFFLSAIDDTTICVRNVAMSWFRRAITVACISAYVIVE